jgi:hypothetical protein
MGASRQRRPRGLPRPKGSTFEGGNQAGACEETRSPRAPSPLIAPRADAGYSKRATAGRKKARKLLALGVLSRASKEGNMPVKNASQIVARKIRVLRILEKIFRHPENVELAKLIFPQLSTAHAPVEEVPREPIMPLGMGLRATATKAAQSIRGDFDYHGVEAVMLQYGYDFKSADRRNAISGVLRHLVAKGTLIQVRKGEAGNPNTYRNVNQP